MDKEEDKKPDLILPDLFIERMQQDLGEEAALFFEALNTESPVSIRINRDKNFATENYERVTWCETGYYLPERPVFTLDPLFHAGAYYVQEASSMFLEQVLMQTVDLKQGLHVLDLCASPGGKSTHLVSLLPDHSLLVSNEVIRQRAKVLAENMSKWGKPNVVVTNNDPSDFRRLAGFFDVIVVDAPCSGEGLFRKDPEAVNEWSEENVNLCSARQKRIVADVWDALKPGGVMIYSTCTYNRQEDEDNIRWMVDEMEAEILNSDIILGTEIIRSDDLSGYHFYPHKIKGEGFFISALRKGFGSNFSTGKLKKPTLSKVHSLVQKEVSGWVKDALKYDFWSFQDKVLAFPGCLSYELLLLIDTLSIVQAGIEICEIKGRDIIPSQKLALSCILKRDAFMAEELDLQMALTYLKKEEIKPTGSDRYLMVTYKQTPLGFLKKAGNRYNNLYPKEWRIRMDINK